MRNLITNSTRTYFSGLKQALFDKHITLEEKLELYRNAKMKHQRNNTIDMINVCLVLSNQCSLLKKETELKECVHDLSQYCSELNEQSERNVDEQTWNYLVQSFARDERYGQMATYWYKRIKDKGLVSPTYFTLNALLKVCSNDGEVELCEQIVNQLEDQGKSNEFTYYYYINTLIKNKNLARALDVFVMMGKKGIVPNVATYISLLKEATIVKSVQVGMKVIEIMQQNNVENEQLFIYVSSFSLKVRTPIVVVECFARMDKKGLKNVISWNCLIQAYVQMNDMKNAMKLIEDMKYYGIKADSKTFIILLKVCANSKLYEEGKRLHNLALNTIQNISVELISTILSFYITCEHPEIAIKEFHKLKQKGLADIISWNCLIQAYIQMNDMANAIKLIEDMKNHGIKADSKTFIILLKVCANSKLYEEGKRLHNLALNTIQEISVELSNSILSFYTKCEHPEIAIKEFHKMKHKGLKNVVSWNCLIQAHVQMNDISNAVRFIEDMKNHNINPSSTTFSILITACANSKLYEEGKQLHILALNTIQEISVELSNSILSFYTKCEHPEIAIKEFHKMKQKGLINIVSWNCLIQAYISRDLNEAILMFEEMKEIIEPNVTTYIILLSGCGEYVSADIGKNLITEIKFKELDMHEEVMSVMIYFYSRISEDLKANRLFDKILKKDPNNLPSLKTYNNMLSCYAHHGKGIEAQQLYKEMHKQGVTLNQQTFTIMLNAFSHSGMVNEAIQLYGEIKLLYGNGLSPITTGAMVEVFARAGRFDEALELIDGRMDFVWWNTLLGASRKHNNIELGEKAFNNLIRIDKKQASPYVLMSNIYSYFGLDKKVEQIRQMMEMNGIQKSPGIVYHEESGKLYQFISGYTDYERYDEIEKMREEIYLKIIRAGFRPDTRWVSNTKLVTEEEKIESLCRHAEKMAIAHAFVLNPKRKKILLRNNLRVCNDYHSAIEYISKVLNVEIIVREASRYHHFKDGKCSCDGYW